MNTNTDNAVELNTPFVYVHTFSNGSKYFGNGVNKNRPYDFAGIGRGKKYQSQLEQYGEPTIEVISCQSIEEADTLEQSLFDDYIADGGLKLQRRPSGKDLANAISKGKSNAENKTGFCAPGVQSKLGKIGGKIVGKSNAINKTGFFADGMQSKGGKISGRSQISMLDGRVTSKAQTGHWNKKDPSYIGTWVPL